MRNAVIPDDKGIYHSFAEVQDKVNEQLNFVLNEETLPYEPNAFKLAKAFHKSCMDQATRERDGKFLLSSLS